MAHHWQAIYRHAFYRGGPILTSALSGIDQALWDIKGKALGVPVYELLGGPTRDRVRVYAHAGTPEAFRAGMAKGFTAFKTGPRQEASRALHRNAGRRAVRRRAIRRAAQSGGQRSGYRHRLSTAPSARPPRSCSSRRSSLISPCSSKSRCQAQNHDVMAEIARGTFLPIATGERVFTKWGFREVLEKRPPSCCSPICATPAASPKCA